MNMMILPVIPDISNFSVDNWLSVANIFIIIAFAVLAAFCVSKFAANKWDGNKGKTALGFIGITIAFTILLIYFFGCSAITVRGIIFCLILLLSS